MLKPGEIVQHCQTKDLYKITDRVGQGYYSAENLTEGCFTSKLVGYKLVRVSKTKEKVLEELNQTEDKKGNEMKTLYEYKGKYVHLLATNSDGKHVVEEKGTGEVFSVEDNSLLVEVIPYSIGVKFNPKGKVYHYTAPKDTYKEGEFYLVASDQWAIVQVVAVDTRSKSATKEFKPLGKLSMQTE